MRRNQTIFAALLVSALVASCGSSTITPAPSAAASAAASAPGVPIVSVPSLPTGWARHEAPGAFTIGVPETWLVLTSTERDDPTAAMALKAKYPTHSTPIDSALGQMRDQGLLIFAVDVSGDTSVFATNMNILKVPGPLDQASATSAAAVVQKQFKLDTPLNVEAVKTPAGAYRYQFAENLVATSIAGIQYLFPSGSDVYVMTFLTTVAQAAAYGPTVASMAGTFAATTAVPGAAPVTTTTPAASPAPAASLDPSKFDPKTGSPLDESLPDVCVLVPLDTVKTASGIQDAKQGSLHLWNSCDWVFPDKSGITLTVLRYIDAAHALAAMSSEVAHPGYAGQTYAPLVGVGDSAFIDRPGGDAWAVDGSWVVFVGVGSGIPLAIRGPTTETVLAAAVLNLPR